MNCPVCGLPGEFTRQAEPFGLYGMCDACWIESRRIAWRMYKAALRLGTLVPGPTCVVCLKPPHEGKKLTGHHWNYLRPLDVHWCHDTPCHIQLHERERRRHRDGAALTLLRTAPREQVGSG